MRLRFAIVAVLLCAFAVPASAGLPPGILLSVTQSGAPNTSCLAHGLFSTGDYEMMETFAEMTDGTYQDANSENWVAMWNGMVGNNTPHTIGGYYVYNGEQNYDFLVWSGLSATSTNAELTAQVWDPSGTMVCNVSYQDEFGEYHDRNLRHGDSWTFNLYAPMQTLERWDWGNHVYAAASTVPEPGSLIAILTGLIGTVGFIRRRSHP